MLKWKNCHLTTSASEQVLQDCIATAVYTYVVVRDTQVNRQEQFHGGCRTGEDKSEKTA